MSNALLYIVTVLVWGSTWLAIEFQLGVVEPEVSIVYRYAGASLLLFAWSRIRGLRLQLRLRLWVRLRSQIPAGAPPNAPSVQILRSGDPRCDIL